MVKSLEKNGYVLCIGYIYLYITFYIFHDSTKSTSTTIHLLLYQKEYDFQTLKALNFKVYYPVGFLTLNRERYYCAQDDDSIASNINLYF